MSVRKCKKMKKILSDFTYYPINNMRNLMTKKKNAKTSIITEHGFNNRLK
jgi:hypothetical protein